MPPSTKQRLKSAKAALDARDYAQATTLSLETLSLDPNNYHAHVFHGVAQSSTNNLPEALAAYAAAIALRPTTALAHKGVIDAVNPDDSSPAHRLALARSHLALASIDTPSAAPALAKATALLYALAKEDPTLTDEALAALALARATGDPPATPWARRAAWREADLHAPRIPSDAPARLASLEAPPLSDALDALAADMPASALLVADDAPSALVIARALLRAQIAERAEESIAFLKHVGAHEALLELAETDSAAMHLPADVVAEAAVRALRLAPHRRTGRARFVAAAELANRTEGLDVAAQLAGLSAVAGVAARRRVDVSSSTHGLVTALLHLRRGENKLAVEAARAGLLRAEEDGGRGRQCAVLSLLAAAAFCGDRKYKESIREYGKARTFAQREGDVWMEAAANRGLVDTSVIGHGRKSRQTSIAVEEAAGSSVNTYGLLECVWTDALADDVDSDRMAELTQGAVEDAKAGKDAHGELCWEYTILNSTFAMSKSEMAAVALTRLGQMLIQQYGSEPSVLTRAQKCQMDAAGLYKGLSNPFAQLGWIFEQLANSGEAQKMSMRAIRCYEKAVTIDAAHPLASRRLARMLIDKGLRQDSTELARQASDSNPKARWAHNIVGWSRIAREDFSEAAVSFRDALRGRPKRSAGAEETLFGTDVGRAEDDNDLVVDVDSWRGLSAAYRGQRKFGPAVACIEDALALLHKPPILYTIAALLDIAALQDSLQVLLESERAMLLQLQRHTDAAVASMESVLRDSRSPLTIKSYLSEAHVYLAATEWISGCYHKSTRLRIKGAQILETALVEHCEQQPHLNPASTFKRLGDTLMEAATPHPGLLKTLIPSEQIDALLSRALVVYSKALHCAPWDRTARAQDLAAAMLRFAVFTQNESLAKEAVALLLRNGSDPSVLAISLLTLAALTSRENISRTANQLAVHVARSTTSRKHLIALNVSIAIQASTLQDIGSGGESAISAIRRDPTDWRGWYAVAAVREADARQNSWPLEMIRSSEDAYKEADRLGGGPLAVHGMVRCGTELLRTRKQSEAGVAEVYSEACFYASTASRIGLDEPSVCREIIDAHRSEVENKATSTAKNLALSENPVDTYRHVHLYPFLPDVASLPIVPC